MWHYTCNGKQFLNKFSAIDENIISKHPIHFHTPDAYHDFDFSKEPDATWHDILKQEAINIRDSYKTVKLWYSGGVDSHLVLNTFVKNDIHVDEICCMKSGFEDVDTEITDHAQPFLKTIQKQIPKTKINIIEPTIEDYEKFHAGNSAIDWNYTFRLIYHTELIKDQHQQKGTTNVFGANPPLLIYKEGKWYTYWTDGDLEPNSKKYNFFADNPLVHAKQCHMLVNAIKETNFDYRTICLWPDEKSQHFYRKHTGRYDYGTKSPLKKLYFGQAEKNYFMLDNEKICYSNHKERYAIETALKKYPHLITSWKKKLHAQLDKNSLWWNNGTPEYGTMGILSKFYCLDEKMSKTVDELYPDGFKI